MKKVTLAIIALTFIIVGCSKEAKEVVIDTYGYDLPNNHILREISPEEFSDKRNSEDMFIVFGRVT